GAGRAIWILAWHSLDSDRCNARRRRARYDCSLRLDPAWRKNARSNGEGRNWTRRWPARSRQCPGDHDYPAGGSSAGGGSSTCAKSLGRFHHRDHYSSGADYGRWTAHGEGKRLRNYGFWIARSGIWRVGWTISGALSRDRSVVPPRPEMAGM